MSSPEDGSPFRQRVGLRIREAREARGMTQTQLAHALGVANTQVSRWETGRYLPERYFDALEQALGVPAEHLLGGNGQPTPPH